MTKRAITLAGGGPAAGLHIGVLEELKKADITFDVWALSCIGAWVGIVYNQTEKDHEVEQTYDFFKNGVFRNDASYSSFPINTVFGPDLFGNIRAIREFMLDPNNYKNLVLPDEIMNSYKGTMDFLSDPKKWNEGDFNQWLLNHVMAPNPFLRYMMSMMYLSGMTGCARIYYPESSFMNGIQFKEIYKPDKPYIYHNAWNLSRQKLEMFSNAEDQYKPISAGSLCACSALPFIEGTVDLDGETYCEGALIDTVNFESLLQDHPDLDEIWISRIVDAKQVRRPKNLTDALSNLCQLFAATVGEDDIKLFKYHLREEGKWNGTVVEIRVDSQINFEWSHKNLDQGRERGKMAATESVHRYRKNIAAKTADLLII